MDFSFQAQGRVEMLKGRAKRCVCKYCGGRLRLKRIIFSDHEDARVEIYCDNCERIEYGVEQEIYQSARYFVDELKFNCYPNQDANESTRRMTIAKQMTISKVCEIMAWENKNLGLLDRDGFRVPLEVNGNILGECIILTDEDLLEDEAD